MKTTLQIRRILAFAGIVLSSMPTYATTPSSGESDISNPFNDQSLNINGNYSYDDFRLNATNNTTILTVQGGKFESKNISLTNTTHYNQCSLIVASGTLISDTITLSSEHRYIDENNSSDTYLRISGGTANINTLNLGVAGDLGRNLLVFNGGNLNVGKINGNTTSDFIFGHERGASACNLTIGGTISVDTITVYDKLTSVSLADSLLASAVDGVVTVFEYNALSQAYDYIYTEEGPIVPDTMATMYKTLNSAIINYSGTDYDLSEAKVTINYNPNDTYHTGPGSMVISGIKPANVDPIPEPTTSLLSMLGIGVLMLRRRRA